MRKMFSPAINHRGFAPMMFSPAFQRRDAMPSPQMGIAGFKPGDSYFILKPIVLALKCRAKHNPAINHRDAAPKMFNPAIYCRGTGPSSQMGIAGFKPGDSYFIIYPIVPALKCRAKHNPAINLRR